MRTQAEILELIERMFPARVYVAVDMPGTPPGKEYLVQFYTNPPRLTLLMSSYGSTVEEAMANGRAAFAASLPKHALTALDNRKQRPKYPNTPEGKLERVVDDLIEIFSGFLSEVTSEPLDTENP